MDSITGAELRARWRQAPAAPVSVRRRAVGAAMGMVGMALIAVTPSLADATPAYRLQGATLSQEFVVQPYWLTPGTLAGRHLRLEAGLLGFTDGAGHTAGGYCLDAQAHRRHDAVYRAGATVDASSVRNPGPVRWLLARAFPNGPALLGGDRRGLARSGSVVQAAIWHFADGFELDPAGSPQVDEAFRHAYDRLVAQAAAAPAVAPDRGTLLLDAPAPARGQAARVRARVVAEGGGPADDGTVVRLTTDAGLLATSTTPGVAGGSTLVLGTLRGEVNAWLLAPAGEATVRASASLPLAPGHVLVSNLPTQRLVETGWGTRPVSSEALVHFLPPAASPSPSPTTPPAPPAASPRPTPTPSSSPWVTPTATPTAPAPTAVPVVARPVSAGAPPSAPEVRLPISGQSIVAMPSTGRDRAGSLSLGAGLVLLGGGILLGCGAPQRVRSRRTKR